MTAVSLFQYQSFSENLSTFVLDSLISIADKLHTFIADNFAFISIQIYIIDALTHQFSFQFKACLTIDTSNSLQKSIIKLLKQAQKKVLAAKDVVQTKMNEARAAVLEAQNKVEGWRKGNGSYIYVKFSKRAQKAVPIF